MDENFKDKLITVYVDHWMSPKTAAGHHGRSLFELMMERLTIVGEAGSKPLTATVTNEQRGYCRPGEKEVREIKHLRRNDHYLLIPAEYYLGHVHQKDPLAASALIAGYYYQRTTHLPPKQKTVAEFLETTVGSYKYRLEKGEDLLWKEIEKRNPDEVHKDRKARMVA